jgi:hypothetical protein
VKVSEELSGGNADVLQTTERTLSPGGRIVIANQTVRSIIVRSTGSESLPAALALLQNYPNPFNPSTTFSLDLPVRSRVTLEIFNILGQTVARPVSDITMDEGRHSVPFDGRNLATGVYTYRLTVNEPGQDKPAILQKSMLLIK